MKVYIVNITAYVPKGEFYHLVNCEVSKVFDSREKAIDFIEKTWPNTKHVVECPEHWEFGPNEDFSWRACYHIEEREVE